MCTRKQIQPQLFYGCALAGVAFVLSVSLFVPTKAVAEPFVDDEAQFLEKSPFSTVPSAPLEDDVIAAKPKKVVPQKTPPVEKGQKVLAAPTTAPAISFEEAMRAAKERATALSAEIGQAKAQGQLAPPKPKAVMTETQVAPAVPSEKGAVKDEKAVAASSPAPSTPVPAPSSTTALSPEKVLSEKMPTPTKAPKKSGDDEFVKLFGSGTATSLDLSGETSQAPDLMETLTLPDAVAYALKNNPELQSFDARKDSAFWDHAGAYAQFVPSIEFNFAEGAEKSMPGSYNGTDGGRIKKTIHHRRDRSLFVRQSLIDLAIIADIVKTGSALSLTDIERRDSHEGTAFGAASTYLQLLQARKTIEMAGEYKAVLNDLLQRMKARFDGGGATNADIDRIQSRLSVAEAARLQALGEYGMVLSDFKRLARVVPARFEMPSQLIPPVPATAREAMEVALKTNPSYQASLKKIDIAQGDRNKSASTILPKVSVEYSNAFNYNAGGAAHSNPIDGVYATQEDSRVMVVARWSLTGGTPFTSTMAGAAKMREMNYKSVDVRSRLEQGIYTAYDALRAAQKRKAVLKENFESDKRIVSELEEQFIHGERSLFEILDSQDRLYATKIELMRTMFTEAVTAYQIRMQMGEIAQAILGDQVR
ncbi:MAG TPA: hypothetical protein DCY07_00655 [Rhodospirillaceae bacterium]|nr:hypothetical protein [Rhodospirillaceae bacterium]